MSRFARADLALPVLAFFLWVLARPYLATAFYGNYDQASYYSVIAVMRRGDNVYAETNRYNYSPFGVYLLLGLSHVGLWLKVESHLAMRGFLTLIEIVDATLICSSIAGTRILVPGTERNLVGGNCLAAVARMARGELPGAASPVGEPQAVSEY